MGKDQRGMLTSEIQDIAQKFMGKPISTIEYRLLPYLQYTVMNTHVLDSSSINLSERRIIDDWRMKGWLTGREFEVNVTKEFWDFMCEVLYHGYVKE